MNYNILYKIFIFSLKFIFLPISFYSIVFFDIFDIDLLNYKKIAILEEKLSLLENKLNDKKLENIELKNHNLINNYDIKNILLYTAGIITTGVIFYFLFNNNNDNNNNILGEIFNQTAVINKKIHYESVSTRNQIAETMESMLIATKGLNSDIIEGTCHILHDNNIMLNEKNVFYITEHLKIFQDFLQDQLIDINLKFDQIINNKNSTSTEIITNIVENTNKPI